MPPRHRGSSSYRGVCRRPSGAYYAEIRSDDVRLALGTIEIAHEAARAYDAAAWRLERPRVQLNFHNVYTREQAQRVAPPPRVITELDREDHRPLQRRLLVVEEDERAMVEWRRRHPEDVATENAFWTERMARRRAERADRRRRKALAMSQCDIVEPGGTSIFSPDDDRWEDIWLDTSDNTTEDDEEEDDDDWE
ncbi:ethylene-responsive transcription factor 13-like [Triticum dicoccoides]|uniref:ethylene-responsive transcription factor 13-like n=1 Tax=Triticum dicoccoides TaxID=85692 RepID=UPI00188F0CDD|nr:ethylene-responsive transcription factor 13-like [Triticum dicoccoides]